MSLIILAIVNGFVLSSMYAIASLGLTLQWGVLKVLNFSHGLFMTWGAFIAYWVLVVLGGNYLVALPSALIISFFLGYLLFYLVIGPLQERSETEIISNVFIGTLAVSIILENIILIVFGGRYKGISKIIPGFSNILGAQVSNQQILLILLGPVCFGVLLYFLSNTRLGMAVKAVAQDDVGAAVVGIDSRKVFALTVSIGSSLAGLAGVLLGAYYYLSPQMGSAPLITALFVLVLGGMGSVKGTILASYIIGFIDAFSRFYIGNFWAEPLLFAIFILVILLRPQGLFGVK